MYEHKFYGERVRHFSDKIAYVLYDAYQRIEKDRQRAGVRSALAAEVNIIPFPEQWPNEQVAEQASIVIDETRKVAYIYHGRTFRTQVEQPTAAFWDAVARRTLPMDDDPAWVTFSDRGDLVPA